MVRFVREGDLLDQKVDALVNTVNCVGVMGRGVALQFKQRFPENFKRYAAACKKGEVVPGRMFIVANDNLFGAKWIVNFPTKLDWRFRSSYKYIASGIDALVGDIRRLGITSIAMPPLGCGLGGLDWQKVRSIIESKMGMLSGVEVLVFEPNNDTRREAVSAKVPNLTQGRAVLLVLCDRYVGEAMTDFELTLLAVHKLMYFIQEDGLDMKLEFSKAAAGPFARNLGNVLKHIEGHFISGYNDGGDSPTKPLTLVGAAVERAKAFVAEEGRTLSDHVDRVMELVGTACDAAMLELLASVHWLCQHESVTSREGVVEKLYAWNDRKRGFSVSQVAFAYERLLTCGWISR